MAAATGMRKSTSINDYPEHLNPFREEHHSKLRFWTLTRKSGRSNSFSLNNIKDFRNTWSLKSFMKKNKNERVNQNDTKSTKPVNGEHSSPVVYRRAIQYGSSAVESGGARSPSSERYVYGGSVTPLPRSRFQERLRSTPPPAASATGNNFTHLAPGRSSFSHRSTEPYALPGLTRGDAGGSRLSVTTVGSVNPFDEDGPIVPARRKKKRAPPPPAPLNTSKASNDTSFPAVSAAENDVMNKEDNDISIDDPSFNVELKIVEEIDDKQIQALETKVVTTSLSEVKKAEKDTKEVTKDAKVDPSENVKVSDIVANDAPSPTVATDVKFENTIDNGSGSTPSSPVDLRNANQDLTDLDNKDVVFEKVDIRLYRRNSSFNSDSIIMPNGITELSPNNKRCKSMSNNVNTTITTYETPLHIDEDNNEIKDVNDNQSAPQKVVCKLLNADKPRKTSIDNSISSTEKEFIEIDRATRELEQEISKLHSFKYMDDIPSSRKSNGNSVSEIKSRFENPAMYSPNPIPKPRRSRAGSESPVSPRND